MDPNTGRLYPSIVEAKKDGVTMPVELVGTEEQAERISSAVKSVYTAEQKAAKKARRKTAKSSRKANR